MRSGLKKIIICLLVSTLPFAGSQAQTGAITELKPIIERLKEVKAYSYQNHTSVIFPNGQKDQVTITVFMDKSNKRLCYKSKNEVVLLNREWMFKADHINKTAGVFNIRSYNKKNKGSLPAIESVFKYDMAAMFLDSVVLRSGKILSSTKKGVLTTYKIGFTNNSSIKEMVLVYNTSTLFPESISFKAEEKYDAKGRKIITETVCDHYTASVSGPVFDEHQYFSIVKGKPVLAQYKNYKVYSVL